MNTLPYANEVKEKKRERERENSLSVKLPHHGRQSTISDAFPSMSSNKLILFLSCQCVNIVQGDGNADFSDLATLVHSRLLTLEKDCRHDRLFILDPSARISGI